MRLSCHINVHAKPDGTVIELGPVYPGGYIKFNQTVGIYKTGSSNDFAWIATPYNADAAAWAGKKLVIVRHYPREGDYHIECEEVSDNNSSIIVKKETAPMTGAIYTAIVIRTTFVPLAAGLTEKSQKVEIIEDITPFWASSDAAAKQVALAEAARTHTDLVLDDAAAPVEAFIQKFV